VPIERKRTCTVKKVTAKVIKGQGVAKAKADTSTVTVEGLKKGKAVIHLTIKTKEAKAKKTVVKKLTVTVKEPPETTLGTESYSQENRDNGFDENNAYHMFIEKGEDTIAFANVDNLKSVSVSSSDESVLTAEADAQEGVSLSPIKAGEAELTITCNLKAPYKGSKTYTISVAVIIEQGPGLVAPDGTYTPWGKLVENRTIIVDGEKIIGANRATLVGELEISDRITEIDQQAFYTMEGLTSVSIPDSVSKIGKWAFGRCAALTSIRLPDQVRTVPANLCSECPVLTEVVLSPNTIAIGGGAFRDCPLLTTIAIPEGTTDIGQNALANTGITELTVPSTVVNIMDGAFTGIATVTYAGTAKGTPWGAGKIVSVIS
ncbi:MAG: leucine-rich repeat domain-containing protein, partial [Eubacterium sp.]|nr:leucine-rich repeat domain-containing protein [Eubacterium sp.]